MTPREPSLTANQRGEKYAKVLASLLNYEPRLADTNYGAFVEEFAAQIEEAEREAVLEENKLGRGIHSMATYEEGFRAAREKAAEIASQQCPDCRESPCEEIAERIRKMEPGK